MRFFSKHKDYIYLVWKNPKTRSRHIIGILKRNGGYEFKYSRGIKEVMEEGLEPLMAFPNTSYKKSYKSKILFPTFSNRIPGPTRVDIKEILERYNMAEYDAFELLKRSGAKNSIDYFEFVDPILDLKQENLKRTFFIAGIRHYCDGNNDDINIGDKVILEKEPKNKHDKFAVKMMIHKKMVGYIPVYYSKEITRFLNQNRNYQCNVIEKTADCRECIKVELILNCE